MEVVNQTDFDAAISKGGFDIVLTECYLNWTNGLWILKTIKEQFPDMPVIMVTDTGNEEIAVEGMKSGLSDYVLKRRLYRLSAAVSESLEKNKLRKENNKANKQSVISEEHLRGVSNYSYSLLVEPDGTLVCECVTETFTSITGFTLNEINARGGWLGLIHPDDIPKFLQRRDRLLSMRSDVSEFRILAKKGEIRWLRDYAQPVVSEKE